MGESLSERIAARSATRKPSRSGEKRRNGGFLALRTEVTQALDDGWPIITIWETRQDEGKLTFSYQTFRRYAIRLILARDQAAQPAGVADQGKGQRPGASATDKATGERASEKPAGIGGFRFEAEPRKEDLP